jgi:hypothetical protein
MERQDESLLAKAALIAEECIAVRLRLLTRAVAREAVAKSDSRLATGSRGGHRAPGREGDYGAGPSRQGASVVETEKSELRVSASARLRLPYGQRLISWPG